MSNLSAINALSNSQQFAACPSTEADLPNDIITNILCHLEISDLAACTGVNRQFRQIALDKLRLKLATPLDKALFTAREVNNVIANFLDQSLYVSQNKELNFNATVFSEGKPKILKAVLKIYNSSFSEDKAGETFLIVNSPQLGIFHPLAAEINRYIEISACFEVVQWKNTRSSVSVSVTPEDGVSLEPFSNSLLLAVIAQIHDKAAHNA